MKAKVTRAVANYLDGAALVDADDITDVVFHALGLSEQWLPMPVKRQCLHRLVTQWEIVDG